MPNEIAEPLNLADLIRDKVRLQIVSTIPDDQINNLIKKEWESFFQAPHSPYSSEQKPSAFQILVRNGVEAAFREKITKAINEHITQFNLAQWESHGKAALREMIKGMAPAVLEGISEKIAFDALSKISQNRVY